MNIEAYSKQTMKIFSKRIEFKNVIIFFLLCVLLNTYLQQKKEKAGNNDVQYKQHTDKPIIFIGGSPRSGTTLIVTILLILFLIIAFIPILICGRLKYRK